MTRIALTLCSSLALASCGEPIRVGAPPPPSEYMVCEKLPVAPDLKPLEAFQLSDGRMVYLKADVDSRDSRVARYILEVRGAWFDCSNQLGKVRDYHAAN